MTQEIVSAGISLGSSKWSICHLGGNQQKKFITPGKSHTMPSALVPRFPGEPVRFDSVFPPNPRGAGEDWPLDSFVSATIGAGRLPIAASWTGRIESSIWRWQIDGVKRELNCIDAIGAAYRELVKRANTEQPVALVIPNDFRQQEQQRIIDDCQSIDKAVSLIWLPVAATLAWMKLYDLHETTKLEGKQILIINAEWGRVYSTRLRLKRDEKSGRLLPARSRPKNSDFTIAGFGWSAVASCSEQMLQKRWRELFSSAARQLTSQALKDQCATSILDLVTDWDIEVGTKSQAIEKIASEVAKHNSSLSTMLVLGDFAEQLVSHQSWKQLVSCCRMKSPKLSIHVYPGIEGDNLLAQGAATFALEKSQGIPSYMDTLPQLELFIERGGKYEWLSLLGDSIDVAGGVEWKREPPVMGLQVPKGASRVKLVVAHEEHEGVRELSANLSASVVQDTPVLLNVSCTPAQGNAKLRVDTLPSGGLPATSINADWHRMEIKRDEQNNVLDKIAYLKFQPRAFPHTRYRPASKELWFTLERKIDRLLSQISDASSVSHYRHGLDSLVDCARHQSGRSAIDSKGKPPNAIDKAKLDQLSSLLLAYTMSRSRANAQSRANVMKYLAFVHADNPGLDTWIGGELENCTSLDEPLSLVAGYCIRSPRTANVFFKRLIRAIPESPQNRLLNYHLRSLGVLLTFRPEAMSQANDSIAYRLVEECLNIFEHNINEDNLWFLFEHSGLVLVYVLRFRKWQKGFLDPESNIARRAKSAFQMAIEKLVKDIKEGGLLMRISRAERLKGALQQLIDYIDKRGTGDILIGQEDS